MKFKSVLLATVLSFAVPVTAFAQGIPTFDSSNFANMLKQLEHQMTQIKTMTDQLNQAKAIFDQAKGLKDSFNQLTNIGDLASALKNPDITKLLPDDFKKVETALKDLISGNASKYDHYSTPGNDFYAQELKRQKKETYSDMAVGEAVYTTAGKRVTALEELRDKVKTASTPKEVMDLQARISAESALLQNEVLRMQGLAMVADARNRVDDSRAAEDFRKRVDEMGTARVRTQ